MKRQTEWLTSEAFDILVIGGGITGACIAHDAALRGLKTAMVEKGDFGGFTSSASSKLLHGGIRYLPKMQMGKVRESAREQIIFQVIAPHLTRWIPFLVPTKKGKFMQGRLAMRLAMTLYRVICYGLAALIRDSAKQSDRPLFYSRAETIRRVPLLEEQDGLSGAQELWESHMFSSERMTLAFVKSAVTHGAVVVNYAEVIGLLREGKPVTGARVLDRLSGEELTIRAALVINAAGPEVQAVNSSVPELRLKERIQGFSRGVHLVTRCIEEHYALALVTGKKIDALLDRGGRHFFIIPWRGCSLIGTTNVPFDGDLDTIRVTGKDVDDFLEEINGGLGRTVLRREDVRYAFTGLYPLISGAIKSDTYQGTGEYQIIDHSKRDGVEGIITALGAKYTTARLVAERTVDLALRALKRKPVACTTATVALVDGGIASIAAYRTECAGQYIHDLEAELVDYLITAYGSEAHKVIELGRERDLLRRIHPDREALEAEVAFAVLEEMAMTLDDVVFRRTGLGTIGYPGDAVLDRAAGIMASLLGWNEQQRREQIARVKARYDF